MTSTESMSRVRAFLLHAGLLRLGETFRVTALSGGVSSNLLCVELAGRTICVKSALARLKVEQEWFAPLSRNRVEHDWLCFAAGVAPGQVPEVLAHDADAGLIAMEFLPAERYPGWKLELFAGHVDQDDARAVGDLLGRLHAASATNPDCRRRFATDDNFDALRIEPYLRATARVHRDLEDCFDELIATTTSIRHALVHGDVSPKNILLGPEGPVLLDAECAWFGDPAFDLAFCLNHLLLKAVRMPDRAAELCRAALSVLAGHAPHRSWELAEPLDRRIAALLPALALARVDGRSPVEYLDRAERSRVRAVARDLALRPAPSVADLVDRWRAGLATAVPAS